MTRDFNYNNCEISRELLRSNSCDVVYNNNYIKIIFVSKDGFKKYKREIIKKIILESIKVKKPVEVEVVVPGH